MQIQNFNTKEKVFIIAEIGNNHEGSYALAEEMIGLAADAGADAVKFQTFIPGRLVSAQQKERTHQLKKFQLSYNEFGKLAKVAKNQDVIFLSTPFDIDSVLFLNDVVPAFKIASGDNDFFPLIEVIAETGKPIMMSTGFADIQQIIKSKTLIEKIWTQQDIIQDLAILHCVSAYPVEPKFANLKAIQTLRESLDCTIGFSDHSLGTNAAIASVGLGSRIIEKHFTIDKHFSDFRDHQLSADPKEMKQLIQSVREVEKMLGSGDKVPQVPEIDSATQVRRSIVAKHPLSEGHIFQWDDITWIRPGGGLDPGEEQRIIGKRLNQDVQMGEKILMKHISDDN